MRSALAAAIEGISQGEMAALAEGQFAARDLEAWPHHLIARTGAGHPSVLLAARDVSMRAGVRLSGLEVRYSLPCQLAIAGKPTAERTLTVITCLTRDPTTEGYFLHLVEALLRAVGSEPPTDVIATAVQSLVDILQQLANPPRKAIAGCFAELLLIARSRDAAAASRAWRSGADDRFDFSIGDARLEVKSTSGPVRAHHFSVLQCSPPAGTTGALASLFVQASPAGLSLGTLIERIERRLSACPDLILKLRRVIAMTLGSSAPVALEIAFDEQLANESLRLFDMAKIPGIRLPLPAELSEVRFCSNLGAVAECQRADLVAMCPQLDAILPL